MEDHGQANKTHRGYPMHPTGSQHQGSRSSQRNVQGSVPRIGHMPSDSRYPGRHASDPRYIYQRPLDTGQSGTTSASNARRLSLPESLVYAATDSSKPVASRLASLQQLHQTLYAPRSQAEALQHLTTIWPPLVALLWDPKPAICTAAAAPVGALGALAAQAAAAAQHGGSSGSAGGMLFDWLLPVLESQRSPSGAQLKHAQMAAILISLRNCMAGVDGMMLARYANAVFEICQSFLEEEGTSPQLLPPLLEVVMQASRHQHSLRSRFRDCVDVLLGWALEPSIAPSARNMLARTFLSFGPVWKQQHAFAVSLLNSLLENLEGSCKSRAADVSATKETQSSSDIEVPKALGLTPCILAILEAAGQPWDSDNAQATGALMRLCLCLSSIVRNMAQQQTWQLEEGGPVPPPPSDMASITAELAGHVSKLAELAKLFAQSIMEERSAEGIVKNFCASSSHAYANDPPTNSTRESVAKKLETPHGAALSDSRTLARLQLAVFEGHPQAVAESGGPERSLVTSLESMSLGVDRPGRVATTSTSEPHVQATITLLQGDQLASLQDSAAGAIHTDWKVPGRDRVLVNLGEAVRAAVGFVTSSLQLPSIAARPDAVSALLSVLKRWLGVAEVLRERESEGQLHLMWEAVEALLFHRPASSISSLRLCHDKDILLRCAELYFQAIRLSPTAFQLLVEEMGIVSTAAQQLQRDAARVPPGEAFRHSRHCSSYSVYETGAVLAFDLELLSMVLFSCCGNPQLVVDKEWQLEGQHAVQQQGIEAAKISHITTAQWEATWHLLYRLCDSTGGLLPSQPIPWSQAFTLLQSVTLWLAEITDSGAVYGTELLKLLNALVTSTLHCSKFSNTIDQQCITVDTAGEQNELNGCSPRHAIPAPVVVAALEQLWWASSFVVGCVSQSLGAAFSIAAAACCCSQSIQAALCEVQRACQIVASLSVMSSTPSVRAAAISCLGQLFSGQCSTKGGSHKPTQLGASGASAAGDPLKHVLLADTSVVATALRAAIQAAADCALTTSRLAQQLLLRWGSFPLRLASIASCWPVNCHHLAACCTKQGRYPPALLSVSEVLDQVSFASGVQRQHLIFKPTQLAQILDYLRGALTGVIGSADTKTDHLQDWLPRLMGTLQDLPPSMQNAAEVSYEGPRLELRNIRSYPELALFAVHEAARHLVASRLKSFHGNASQTFAVLDRALQKLHALSENGLLNPWRPWLLLELVHSLEQEIFNAHEGSIGRPPPVSTGALVFFTGNKKVCQDWFLRMQPLLLQEAAASQHHTLTLRLGIARLQRLEEQARQLLSLIPPQGSGSLRQLTHAQLGNAKAVRSSGSSKLGLHAPQEQAPPTTKAAPADETSPSTSPSKTENSAHLPTTLPAGVLNELSKEQGEHSTPATSPMATLGYQGSQSTPSTSTLSTTVWPQRLLSAVTNRSAQQAQQLWHRISDVAAVTARALCMLRDPAGVLELHVYLASAFRPLRDALAACSVAPITLGSGVANLLAAVEGRAGSTGLQISQPSCPGRAVLNEEVLGALESPCCSTGGGLSSTGGLDWDWLEAVRLHAAGQYEAALQEYVRYRGSSLARPVVDLLGSLQAEAYTAVQDWSGLFHLPQVPDVHLSDNLRRHCLALASWASGDMTSAKRPLSQHDEREAGEKQRPGVVSPGSTKVASSGPLQAALVSALARETACMDAVLRQAEQPTTSSNPGRQPGRLHNQGVVPLLEETGVLSQMQLSLAAGGTLGSGGPLLSSLAPLLAQQDLENHLSDPTLEPSNSLWSANLPFSTSLLCFCPWNSVRDPPGWLFMRSISFIDLDANFAPLKNSSRSATNTQASATDSFGGLLAAARVAAAAGNLMQCKGFLDQAQEVSTSAGLANTTPGGGQALQQAALLELSLGRLCIDVQRSAGGADLAGLQQSLWHHVLKCSTAVDREAGGVQGHAALMAAITAGSVLLLLEWAAPGGSKVGRAPSLGAGAAEMPTFSEVGMRQVAEMDTAQILQQAKSIATGSVLPVKFAGDIKDVGSQGLEGLPESHDDSKSNKKGKGVHMAALEAELLSELQPSAVVAMQYAALKMALATLPSCAQLWWKFAEWSSEYGNGIQNEGPERHCSIAAAEEAIAAAFMGFCKVLSLGRCGTSADDMPALLHILRMTGSSCISAALVDHGLSVVPASTWLPVLPQLLARLATSCFEEEGSASTLLAGKISAAEDGTQLVHRALVSILVSLAKSHPAAVLLPVLNELREFSTGNKFLKQAFQMLVGACRDADQQLPSQLNVFCEGCTRMAVLWEEEWHSVLQEAGAAASRGVAALQEELKTLPEDQQGHAIQSGYLFALAPALHVIRERMENDASNTPHDEQMVSLLRPMIQTLYEQLVQAPSQASDLSLKLQIIKEATARVGQELKARHHVISRVAPALLTLQSTSMRVPGTGDEAITIQAIQPVMSVLHTKTRPKKLSLLGSDGRRYQYLLKGKEDLRTDERLGQFLRMTNAALQHSKSPQLQVQTFNVTPVSRRTGLVQWVENTVPMYQLYSAWHKRKAERAALLASSASHTQQSKEKTAAGPSEPQRALKPVELFYKALIPALKAAGVDPASPRAAWPLTVMQHVYRSLAAAAPRSMLANELWCAASSPTHWWSRQQAYAQSTAAMSMVGYLLGLGDRHLDNILLHKQHGTVVHLDFNVIFDRGLLLKVPEVVPFRLTPSLVAALGPAGAHGRFELSCKQALQALRANSKPLQMLLESSLVDPLVDWNVEEDEKEQRHVLELATALQLFTMLLQNSKQSFQLSATASAEALDQMMSDFGSYTRLFRKVASAAHALKTATAELHSCQAILADADGLEQAADSKVRQGQLAVQEIMAQAVPVGEQVVQCLQECQAWQEGHAGALRALLAEYPVYDAPQSIWDPQSAPTNLSLTTSSPTQGQSILQVALEMLLSEAPLSAQVLLQASVVDDMGAKLLAQRAQCVQMLSGSLRQYASVLRLLGGLQYLDTSQHGQWAATFQAALALPVPHGFQQAAQLAPRKQDSPLLLPTWQSLAAASRATSALLQSLESSQKALVLEKVDLALSVTEAQERILGMLRSDQSTRHVGVLLRAFAAFSHKLADAALSLPLSAEEAGGTPTLDSLTPLTLGYITAAVIIQQAGGGLFESLFTATDGSSRLDWLTPVVQSLEAMASLSLELQLVGPALLSLALSQHAQCVTESLAGMRGFLQPADGPEKETHGSQPLHPSADAATGQEQPPPLADTEGELEALAAHHAPLGTLLQLLLQLHATAANLAGTAGAALGGCTAAHADVLQPDKHRWLVRATSNLWDTMLQAAAKLQQAVSAAATPALGAQTQPRVPPQGGVAAGETSEEAATSGGAVAAPEAGILGQDAYPIQQLVADAWEGCSAALAGLVGREVSCHAAPAVGALFRAAAHGFEEGSASLDLDQRAQRQQQLAPAEGVLEDAAEVPGVSRQAGSSLGEMGLDQSRHADLVPFTDFEEGVVPRECLLGELEPGGGSWEGAGGVSHAKHEEESAETEQGVPDTVFRVLVPPEGLSPPEHAQRGGGGECAQGGHPPLVPFMDFNGGMEGDTTGLLEPLEEDEPLDAMKAGGEDGSLQPDVHEGVQQGGQGGVAAKQGTLQQALHSDQTPGGDEEPQQLLAGALGIYADAAGLLAAVDSQQYLTGLAISQCRQQSQQANAELFRLEWLCERDLLGLGIQTVELGAWMTGAGMEVQGSSAAGAPVALVCSRAALLSQLQQAVAGATHLQVQVQQWQAGLDGVAQVLEQELSATMLFAVPQLKGQLGRQYQWLASSNMHVNSLLQLSQALVQFESSRFDSPVGAEAQLVSWQRYTGVIHQMQRLFEAHMAASANIRDGMAEIDRTQRRRSEATASLQGSQMLAVEADAQLRTHSLPFLKATRALGASFQRQRAGASRMAEQAAVLQGTLQQASMLRSSLIRAQRMQQTEERLQVMCQTCMSFVEQLQRAVRCLANIPAAMQAAERGLRSVTAVLAQEKGKGEAAAKTTAAALVATMEADMASLASQMDGLPTAKMLVRQLPASLAALVEKAQQHADELAREHSLDLLPSLRDVLGHQTPPVMAHGVPAKFAATDSRPCSNGGCSAVLHKGHMARRKTHADTTMAVFKQKLDGRWPQLLPDCEFQNKSPPASISNVNMECASTKNPPSQKAMSVEDVVQALISAATSDSNLARMYEGWMAWV